MDRNAFADKVTGALTSDIRLMDSVVGMHWNKAEDALLVRVQPLNQMEWREGGLAAMDALRELAERVKITCQYQLLRVRDAINIVFAIKPQIK